MCIYIVKKQKLRSSTERPKIGVSGVKDTAKTNKD